jgi:hypothetical protein
LRAGADRSFTRDDAALTEAVIPVLHGWLSGVTAAVCANPLEAMLPSDDSAAFLARFQEELERARRMDLRLSFILVDIGVRTAAGAAPIEPAIEIQAALRRELRGSDLLGTMAERRVGAVLAHTDADALQVVVRRLKQRLAEAARSLNLSSLRLGRAVLTPDCPSADALVARALKETEIVAAFG